MARYVARVPTSLSQEEVYAYLADFRSITQWDPSISDAELVSGTPGEVGARYRLTMRGKTELVYDTLEAQTPSRLVYRAETGTFVSLDTVTVTPDGTLEYDARLTLKGLLRLADPVMGIVLKRLGDKARDGLVRELARTSAGR